MKLKQWIEGERVKGKPLEDMSRGELFRLLRNLHRAVHGPKRKAKT